MKSLKVLLGIVLAVVMVCSFSQSAPAQENAKVKDAMKALQDKVTALGAAKVDGVSLYFGEEEMNGNYDIVDEVAEANTCTATMFVKKDDGFMRISTNVIKDGNRAVGTMLDPAGEAFAAISKGEAYYGQVDILGSKYDAGYEPIKDANGAVVGVLYVGFKL
jgi:hypothetical protein